MTFNFKPPITSRRSARRNKWAAAVVGRKLSAAALILLLLLITSAVSGQDEPAALDHFVESVEFHNTPIQDVLRLLATQNNLNLIIGPDSMGNISMRLSSVTLRAALDAILRSKGFHYTLYDNILMVSAPDSLERLRGMGLTPRVFHLKYVDARDVKAAIDTAKVLSPWGSASVYSATLKNDAGQAAQIIRASQQQTIGGTVGGLGGGGGGSLLQQPRLPARSNSLIVTDRPENLRAVERLIAELDKPVKQLLIDIHFVETILDDQNQLGIDWTQLLSVEGSYRQKTAWSLGGEPPAGRTGGGGILQLGTLSESRFRAVLDMMLTNNRANLLSQPRIITLDNQPASIFVGVTTWIEERSGSEQSGTLAFTYTERQVPIELIVVPHIIGDQRVLLELQPRVEEITGWQEGAQGQQLPIISARTADSRIEVVDGETAIIGGLLKEKSIWVTKRVRLLGSLPLIGHLFQNRQEQKQRTDLTIFITTRILDPGGLKGEAPSVLGITEENPEPEIWSKPVGANPRALEAGKSEPEDDSNKIELSSYFPISDGAKWRYEWRSAAGSAWEASLSVSEGRGGVWLLEERPTGGGLKVSRYGLERTPQGWAGVFKVEDGDSVVFTPPNVMLPERMAEGRTYETSHQWRRYDATGRPKGTGRVIQRQRLVGFYNVTTRAGRFRDCAAIETETFDESNPTESRQRLITWYSAGIGPVKIEQGIGPNEATLKGTFSATLIGR